MRVIHSQESIAAWSSSHACQLLASECISISTVSAALCGASPHSSSAWTPVPNVILVSSKSGALDCMLVTNAVVSSGPGSGALALEELTLTTPAASRAEPTTPVQVSCSPRNAIPQTWAHRTCMIQWRYAQMWDWSTVLELPAAMADSANRWPLDCAKASDQKYQCRLLNCQIPETQNPVSIIKLLLTRWPRKPCRWRAGCCHIKDCSDWYNITTALITTTILIMLPSHQLYVWDMGYLTCNTCLCIQQNISERNSTCLPQ